MNGFKEFIMRGSVVDLAVAVIVGTAFSGIVDSMTRDIITPLIGLISAVPNFSAYKLGPIGVGNFLNALIAFLIKAFVVYYGIVKPFALLTKMFGAEKKSKLSPDVELLTEIRDILKKHEEVKEKKGK